MKSGDRSYTSYLGNHCVFIARLGKIERGYGITKIIGVFKVKALK